MADQPPPICLDYYGCNNCYCQFEHSIERDHRINGYVEFPIIPIEEQQQEIEEVQEEIEEEEEEQEQQEIEEQEIEGLPPLIYEENEIQPLINIENEPNFGDNIIEQDNPMEEVD